MTARRPRLSKPKQTENGWTINVRDPGSGKSARLGPFATEMRALEARVDWQMERCWEANLRTTFALDQMNAAFDTEG
jgi:hypothetical protein